MTCRTSRHSILRAWPMPCGACPTATAGQCGGGLLAGLKWVERELARKAEHIENVVGRVAREISWLGRA